MILKNVKSYKYARCFAKKSRKCIKKDELAKCKVLKKVRWSSADDHLTF